MSAVLAAARPGDRHTHAASMSDHDAGALISVAVGALVAAAGSGGATTAAVGAGIASGGGAHITARDVVAHGVSGAVAKGSPRTFLGAGNMPAALSGADPVDCRHHHDGPIRTGSASVFADGLRLARRGDETSCGAILCDGDETVLVGGAPAGGAPPDPLAVIADGPAFAAIGVGAALATGTSAITTAARWSEAIAGRAVALVDTAAAEIEAATASANATAGAIMGEVEGALGPIFGATIGR